MTATIANTDHSRCIPGEPCYAGRPVAEVPARKLICLRLVEHANGIKFKAAERCQSERLPGSDLCAHHLADAFREYSAILRPEDFTGGIHE